MWSNFIHLNHITVCELSSCISYVGGGRLNIKMSSYQHNDSHVEDKTVSPTVLSLTWEFPYLGKTVFILRRGPESSQTIVTAEALITHQHMCMCMCMCMYMYMYMYMYMHMHMHMYIYVYLCISMYILMDIKKGRSNTCVAICMYISMFIYLYSYDFTSFIHDII